MRGPPRIVRKTKSFYVAWPNCTWSGDQNSKLLHFEIHLMAWLDVFSSYPIIWRVRHAPHLLVRLVLPLEY
jgi:hypothetical protein